MGDKPSAKNWKPFGYRAYVLQPKQKRNGLSTRGKLESFLDVSHSEYTESFLSDGTIVESRNVKFDGNFYPEQDLLTKIQYIPWSRHRNIRINLDLRGGTWWSFDHKRGCRGDSFTCAKRIISDVSTEATEDCSRSDTQFGSKHIVGECRDTLFEIKSGEEDNISSADDIDDGSKVPWNDNLTIVPEKESYLNVDDSTDDAGPSSRP